MKNGRKRPSAPIFLKNSLLQNKKVNDSSLFCFMLVFFVSRQLKLHSPSVVSLPCTENLYAAKALYSLLLAILLLYETFGS